MGLVDKNHNALPWSEDDRLRRMITAGMSVEAISKAMRSDPVIYPEARQQTETYASQIISGLKGSRIAAGS